MILLRFLIRTSRARMVVAVLAALIAGAASAVMLALIERLVQERHVAPSMLYLAVAGGAMLASRATAGLTLAHLGQDALFEFRTAVGRRVLEAPLRSIEQVGKHRVLSVLADDAIAIGAAVPGLAALVTNAFVVVGVLVFVASASIAAFGMLLAAIAIGVVLYRLPVSIAFGFLSRARKVQDTLFRHFRALAEGLKDLQLNRRRRDRFLAEELGGAAGEYRHHAMRGFGILAISSAVGESLFLLAIAALLLAAPPDMGAARVSLTIAILYLVGPLQSILSWIPILGRARVALENVTSIVTSIGSGGPPATPGPRAAAPRLIELRCVRFAYMGEEGTFQAGPIDLRLTRGEVLFVVGGNGGGKTTLAKLLTGLYTPDSGEILIDGMPVTGDGHRSQLRESFSAVFVDSHSFDRLYDVEISDAEMKSWLETLRLAGKVTIDGGRFSTMSLSHGQWRRLQILGALAEDRPFYVFDEWTADQDPASRAVFYEEILPALRRRGKGVFVISHDERYFGAADRLLYMDDGVPVLARSGPQNMRPVAVRDTSSS